jgi:hypothetical protein
MRGRSGRCCRRWNGLGSESSGAAPLGGAGWLTVRGAGPPSVTLRKPCLEKKSRLERRRARRSRIKKSNLLPSASVAVGGSAELRYVWCTTNLWRGF